MSAPIVTINYVDNVILSKNIQISTLVFVFDTKVTSWVVCAGGTAPFFGTVLAKGMGCSTNESITITINWSDLTEGSNRINIYGLNLSGEWTPYNDERSPNGHLFINVLGASTYGEENYG